MGYAVTSAGGISEPHVDAEILYSIIVRRIRQQNLQGDLQASTVRGYMSEAEWG